MDLRFRWFNLQNFTMLYKTIAQPIVEYCTSVQLNPTRKSDSQLIEKVQKRASIKVP